MYLLSQNENIISVVNKDLQFYLIKSMNIILDNIKKNEGISKLIFDLITILFSSIFFYPFKKIYSISQSKYFILYIVLFSVLFYEKSKPVFIGIIILSLIRKQLFYCYNFIKFRIRTALENKKIYNAVSNILEAIDQTLCYVVPLGDRDFYDSLLNLDIFPDDIKQANYFIFNFIKLSKIDTFQFLLSKTYGISTIHSNSNLVDKIVNSNNFFIYEMSFFIQLFEYIYYISINIKNKQLYVNFIFNLIISYGKEREMETPSNIFEDKIKVMLYTPIFKFATDFIIDYVIFFASILIQIQKIF